MTKLSKTALCASSPITRKTGWTAERRRKHATAMRRWRPWEKSTGPRTAAGKRRAAMNARKHGGRSRPLADFGCLLKRHGIFLSNLNTVIGVCHKYRYYATPGCAAALRKFILAKGLDSGKKITANELLDFALCRRLIRFPNRLSPASKLALVKTGPDALSKASWIT